MWVLTCLEQKARVDAATRRCPAFGSPRGQKHGQVLRRVRGWQHAAIVVQRMRCPACGAT